ncbi:MAG: hypothetical protein HC877_20410 [Thioploca sp.]|nr:hypothetical protein [Thioploca sp.]
MMRKNKAFFKCWPNKTILSQTVLDRIRSTHGGSQRWFHRIELMALLVGSVIVPTTSLAATIQGMVFKDLNGNGQREADDPPIAGQGIGLQNIYAPDWQPIPEDSLNPSDAEGNYAYTKYCLK